MNLIITNIGRRGYLVDYFKEILDVTEKVYTSDCDKTASGLYGNNDGHFILSRPVDDERKYVRELINVCKKNDISVVIPVIDPEIYILSGYKEEFRENGITVVVSDKRVLDICFDKLKMNEFLREIGVSFPKTYSSISEFKDALDNGTASFPIVLKPVLGSGSVDTYFLNDYDSLSALFHDGMLIQEKLNGTEYGIDTFNSFEGKPLQCVIKKKISMRSGETDKSVSVHNKLIESVLLKIAKELGHVGNLDCDIIVSGGIPYVLDLNPRFGGGYPATHAIGVNLVESLYKLLKGERVAESIGNYKDGILTMKEIAIRTTEITEI